MSNIYSFWAGFIITEGMPGNAYVIIEGNNYYPLLERYAKKLDIYFQNNNNFKRNNIPDTMVVRIKEAREDYSPAEIAKEKGDFLGNSQFFITYLLREMGILPELESRWNEDGSWNW